MEWLTTIIQSITKPFRWWIVVATWEQGIRIRLGKRAKRLDPGFHFIIPFVDRIFVRSTRSRIIDANNQSMSTNDGHAITLAVLLRYSITDMVALYNWTAMIEGSLMFEALSAAANFITERSLKEINHRGLSEHLNLAMSERKFPGLDEVSVSVTGFCVARCLRLMTGDGWHTTGPDMDKSGESFEVK